ncbi:MAG: hypothetical protein HOP18_04445 [Deltaproteobacteria bacterium]|nr:hypothetical protein [Deltaproteobacteria bacterium]
MNNNSGLPPLLMILGVMLVGAGGLLLGYVGLLVYQIINPPEEVKIVQFILSHIQIGDRAIYGSIGKETFEVNVAAPVRTALFLFLGVLILGVLAKILSTLISSGLEMIRMAKTPPKEELKQRITESLVRK